MPAARAEGASTSTSPLGGDAGARAARRARGTERSVGKDHLFRLRQIGHQAGVCRRHRGECPVPDGASNSKLKLEGNTDERGTREYNIGLGERRAQAVRRALMLQGAAEIQLTTVSFGAERPAAEGDDEAAWAKNRRVELVYAP